MVEKKKYSQKEIDECLSTFTTIPIVKLHEELEIAQESCRYALVVDKNENSSIYFTYKATMVDFHKEVMKVQLGMQGVTSALESLRKALVYSMRIGDTFVINLDKTAPDFHNKYTHDKKFPSESVFCCPIWHDEEEYMKIVLPEENHDLLKNKDMYMMNEKFGLCVLGLYDSDELICQLCDAIPDSENFVRLIIEK